MASAPKVALVWHGDRESRENTRLEESKMAPLAAALRALRIEPQAAVYNDDFVDEVREQLLQVDAVLVWVNPIEQDRDRSKLDAMLAQVAGSGVLVSAHPATIQKMGTKDVLFRTRDLSFGSDVHRYTTREQLREQLPLRMAEGKPRVLKQHRGHSGNGIWKVSPHPQDPGLIRARHARRGSVEQDLTLPQFLELLEPYLDTGPIIDQAYQDRLPDGMVRCYMVKDKLAGFGHQAINALFPAPEGAASEDAPQPGPRLYYPPTAPEFQEIRRKMENEWLGELLQALEVGIDELPLLWDADFLFGAKTAAGEDSYVLCEINVSSVYPYPEDAIEPLARAVGLALAARWQAATP